MRDARLVACLTMLAAALACRDATSPEPALTGNWVADGVVNGTSIDPLPYTMRCSLLSCAYLVDFQLRFRSRGRVLDVRRYEGSAVEEFGDAYGYHLISGSRIVIDRPAVAGGASADTGTISGDTILLHVARVELPSGAIRPGGGPLFRLIRVETPP